MPRKSCDHLPPCCSGLGNWDVTYHLKYTRQACPDTLVVICMMRASIIDKLPNEFRHDELR